MGQCRVREPSGNIATHARRSLLPMPTRAARQGDWALPVGLSGELSKLNGMRGICGLVGQFPSGDRGIWVSFEPADPTHPPQCTLLAEANLVSLPTPPAGAPRTPWETRALALPSSSSLPALMDESLMESRLALFHGDDDGEDDDASVELSDSSEEEELVLAPGALVSLVTELAKPEATRRYWRVEKLQGEGDLAFAVVRLLNGRAGTEITHKAKDLSLVSEKDLGLASVCQHCNAAEPENELLMCEHFSTSCLGCAHISCLSPPLKKVPKGQWFCQLCRGGGALQTLAKVKPEASKLVVADNAPPGKEKMQPQTQVKAESSVKAGKAKASAKVAPKAKVKPAASRKTR